MATRILYADRGKGIAYPTASSQRKGIRAPELDTSDLVRENTLTLIGRLTNRREQRLRAMFSFFLDRWELNSSFEGSDLAHDSFQLCFKLEEDLQKVLDNRPYQFGRWMVIDISISFMFLPRDITHQEMDKALVDLQDITHQEMDKE
ncbi:unnamed protein product [Microthlaspi erraticum]|uniref:DUF4283 domain-containing protein n=1 Tax=Microthlaspi erraticum TaxID=1685480 RepID=A0A6D2IRX4_9BRAS|nr:unnamed protein product [Microthlaspi erraticum]